METEGLGRGVDRRSLLRGIAAASTGAGMVPLLTACGGRPESGRADGALWRNWSGRVTARPERFFHPPDEDALVELLRGYGGTIRPVGAGHSFSAVAASDAAMAARGAVALLGVAALARAAFYPADGPVATLDPYNFDAFVEAAPLTIVEFYAPWCGHCQQVAPRYLAAAVALSEKHGGRVAFGAMDESDEDNRRLRAGHAAVDHQDHDDGPQVRGARADAASSAREPQQEREHRGVRAADGEQVAQTRRAMGLG